MKAKEVKVLMNKDADKTISQSYSMKAKEVKVLMSKEADQTISQSYSIHYVSITRNRNRLRLLN